MLDSTNNKVTILLYADDIVILAPTPKDLELTLTILEKFFFDNGLEVGINKCGAFSTHVSHHTYMK